MMMRGNVSHDWVHSYAPLTDIRPYVRTKRTQEMFTIYGSDSISKLWNLIKLEQSRTSGRGGWGGIGFVWKEARER